MKKGEVGGSVIIGGHKKKTQKVLQHLRRMYMPLQNYKDLEPEFLENYWAQGKDVLGVTHFGDLVPEVFCMCPEYENELKDLISLRIEYKKSVAAGIKPQPGIKKVIVENKERLKKRLEAEIVMRLESIRKYLRTPMRDPHIALEEIFKEEERKASSFFGSFKGMFQKKSD